MRQFDQSARKRDSVGKTATGTPESDRNQREGGGAWKCHAKK